MTKTPRQILAPHKLSPAGLALLLLLTERGPLNLKQLAALSGYDQPFVSRLTIKLEADEWITRSRDPQDYRSKVATLAVPPEKVREIAAQTQTPAPAA